MSHPDEEKTDPGGHEPPEPPTAREKLRDELADWAPIDGAPSWQNEADRRQTLRFSLLAEVIADREADTDRRVGQVEDTVRIALRRVAELEERVSRLEHPDTQPAPPPHVDA